MSKDEVLKIIDEVMNNREIDSIRNAILAIRDKVIDFNDDDHVVRLELRGGELNCVGEYYPWSQYVCIDTSMKIDTGIYGGYWYE